MQFEVGNIVEGKVTGITNFGAFIQIDGGKTGLVHISEVALSYVKDIKEHLKEGDRVKAKIITIDEKGKISLSIKKALEEESKKASSTPAQVDFKRNDENLSFEDKMKLFMQDSNEKMQDLKRSFESKRGSNYKKNNNI